MEWLLQRETSDGVCTFGSLYRDLSAMPSMFECFTLEDVIRQDAAGNFVKVNGQTAIPEGRYRVIINYSNRFKRYMPLLLNVPYFVGIRIHSGNTDLDTMGCILVGKIQDKPNNRILDSRIAFMSLWEKVAMSDGFDDANMVPRFKAKEPWWLTVRNAPPAVIRT